MQPIDIILSIDTECSIGGAFADPERNTPVGRENMFCTASGHENGLPFLLETLAEHNLKATFFMETLHSRYFGTALLEEVTGLLCQHNQDIQLHLHPCWARFSDPDWKSSVHKDPPHDDCTRLMPEHLAGLMHEGCDLIQNCGAPRPVAFRTGGLQASRSIYEAMQMAGLRIGSNVGLGYRVPDDAGLHFRTGCHAVGEAVETPVTTYRHIDMGRVKRDRILTITACSFAEIRHLLEQACKGQRSPIVLLTHPFEFIKGAPAGRGGVRENRINKARWQDLLGYLASHSHKFNVTTFGALANAPKSAEPSDQHLQVPHYLTALRMLSNKFNDTIPRL